MLDKGPDPDDELVDVGVFRIFKDNDGLAENSSWYKSSRVSDTKGLSDMNNKMSALNNKKEN